MPDRPTPESILQRALGIEGPEEHAAYLDKVCANDPALCDEIESLMAAQFAADGRRSRETCMKLWNNPVNGRMVDDRRRW